MVTKKIRTEYMKKFRDPRWETFSKCYEDSLRYRLTRRVMEHSHKPWFWDGWDSCSDSSGWSTPRPSRNRVVPLSLPPPATCMDRKQRLSSPGAGPPPEDGEAEAAGEDAAVDHGDAIENDVSGASGGSGAAVAVVPNGKGPSDDTETDRGPADSASSDGEAANPPKRHQPRHRRRRGPRSEPGQRDSSQDNDKPADVRKPPRAKSQPAISTKESRGGAGRTEWMERVAEVKRTATDSNTSDACAQTRRGSDKRGCNPERRRARSADLEKMRRSQLTVVDDRWMTEYMRCFSARLR